MTSKIRQRFYRKVPASIIISLSSVGISIITVVISVLTYLDNRSKTKDLFLKTYRPYVFSESGFSTEVSTGHMLMENYALVTVDINAPAFIKRNQNSYFIRSAHGDSLIYQKSHDLEYILPSDKMQMIDYVNNKTVNLDSAQYILPKKFVRKVYIEYTWIGDSKLLYFYMMEQEFDVAGKFWITTSQNAN